MSFGTTNVPGEFLAPFVPSPEVLVYRMLDVARVGPGDTVYDLGSGDGRIVIAAAQRFGANAVGVELDNERFASSSARIRDLGLGPRARILHGDLRTISLGPATVVTMYQLPIVNDMLRPTFERQLRSGARVVTLDFPISGWEPERILTGRLADSSEHAIYLYSINQIRKEAATMAATKYYGSEFYGLELQGAIAGAVRSVEGGDAIAEVITETPGPDFIQRKHLAGVKYEDICVEIDGSMANSVYDWIDATLRRTYPRRDGAIAMLANNYQETSRLSFFHGLISEIEFPASDASGKDLAKMMLKIASEYTSSSSSTTGTNWKVSSGSQKKWLNSNFKLKIDGLDCTGVMKIDALKITQRETPSLGVARDYVKEPTTLDIPNLSITVKESLSETFQIWHEDFVIKGNNGTSNEKNGTLDYLTPDLKTVLFTLTFKNLGIFKCKREKLRQGGPATGQAGASNVSTFAVEMYCEDMSFQYFGTAATGKTSTTQGATTTTPAASGTSAGTPMYVPAAAYQRQLPVVPQEITAPVRLTRSLKFRS